MRKTKLFSVLILLNLVITSCSSDESSETIKTDKLVKSIQLLIDPLRVDYIYNNMNLLSNTITVDGTNIRLEEDYTYNSDNKLTIREYNSQINNITERGKQNYIYNSNGNLINYFYSTNDININIEYNGNILTVSGKDSGNSNINANLELNNKGLVIKLNRSNTYTKFEYDSNGNIISTKNYDNSNNLLNEFILNYDNKINPLYGQFESIYIERFIHNFLYDANAYILIGIRDYSFPFLKNNITSVSKNSNETVTVDLKYDNENYPINVYEEYSRNTYEFDIEYYEQ